VERNQSNVKRFYRFPPNRG